MEQLQPILKHRFWIIFGLVVLVPLVGWVLGKGSITKATEDQIKKIESAEDGLPEGSEHPNDNWIKALQARNEARAETYKKEARHLWQLHQREFTDTWPPRIQPLMKDAGYRQPGNREARIAYRSEFPLRVIPMLEQTLQVVSQDQETGRITGKVFMQPGLLPVERYRALLKENPPSWEQMWDAHEDSRLLRQILLAIRRVNEGAQSPVDAPVRQVGLLELHGGSVVTEGAAAGPAEGGYGSEGAGYGGGDGYGGASMMPSGMGMGGESPYGGAYGGEGGGGRGGAAGANFDVPPPEEFGPPDKLAAAGGEGGEYGGGEYGAGPAAPSAMGTGGGGANPYAGGMMGMAGAQGAADADRYIHDDPSLPFKTRGFKLVVVMKEDALPQLYTELNSMRFPARIVRLHFQEKNLDLQGMSIFSGTGAGASGFSRYGSGAGGGYGEGEGEGSYGAGASMPGMMPGAVGGGMGGPGVSLGGQPSLSLGSATGGASTGYPRSGLGGGLPGLGGGLPGLGGGITGGTGAAANTRANNELASMHQAAMEDPELAQVLIMGIMTIYQPPQQGDAAASANGAEQPGGLTPPSAEQPQPAEAAPGTAAGEKPVPEPKPVLNDGETKDSEVPDGTPAGGTTPPETPNTPADAASPASATPPKANGEGSQPPEDAVPETESAAPGP